jgi:hypothetical protein
LRNQGCHGESDHVGFHGGVRLLGFQALKRRFDCRDGCAAPLTQAAVSAARARSRRAGANRGTMRSSASRNSASASGPSGHRSVDVGATVLASLQAASAIASSPASANS